MKKQQSKLAAVIKNAIKIEAGKRNHLSPQELATLAKQLAATSDPAAAARIRDRLTRGFYGI